MVIHPVFVLLLLGHVLGDFYFQSNKMAKEKDNSLSLLLLHSLTYLITMSVILAVGVPLSIELIYLSFAATLSHFIVDLLKGIFNNRKNESPVVISLQKHSFIIDQFLHILTLGLICLAWGTNLSVRYFVNLDYANLPAKPVLLILGLLYILRPIGILIEKGDIWDFSKQTNKPDDSQQHAGKMIGYLERIIVFFFLIYQQYGAIAFVLTAKSVARFKEIENNKSMAEFYLIGTLISIVSVFIITLLLGLVGNASVS